MANAVVTVATGDYERLLAISGPSIKQYADRIGAKFIALTDTRFATWHLEKFRAREVCLRHDRVIFVDCDIMIRNDADNLFEVVPEHCVPQFKHYANCPTRNRIAFMRRDSELCHYAN